MAEPLRAGNRARDPPMGRGTTLRAAGRRPSLPCNWPLLYVPGHAVKADSCLQHYPASMSVSKLVWKSVTQLGILMAKADSAYR